MINCVVVDGASASIRNRRYKTRNYLSDVVFKTLYDYMIDNKIDVYFSFDSERGSILRSKKREIKKAVELHNKEGNNLLICGKSTGAKVVADVLRDLWPLEYDRICILIVDADWIWRRFRLGLSRKDTILNLPPVYGCHNYYQKNQNLGGGMVRCRAMDFYLHYFTNSAVNHWNIVNEKAVKDGVVKLFTHLLKGQMKDN